MGLQLLERRWAPLLTALDVNGTLLAQTEEVGPGEIWDVDVIALSSSPTTSAVCRLYLDDPNPSNYLTKSVDASEDTFSGSIVIEGGSRLSFTWDAPPTSVLFTARVHYSRYRVTLGVTDTTLLRFG